VPMSGSEIETHVTDEEQGPMGQAGFCAPKRLAQSRLSLSGPLSAIATQDSVALVTPQGPTKPIGQATSEACYLPKNKAPSQNA
jgi:hypothetical protein